MTKKKNLRYCYYFDDDITGKTIQNLIDVLYEKEEVDLYFTTSTGGEVWPMSVLIEFLNKNLDKIKVYLLGRLVSAGTMLLIDYKGKLHITEQFDSILIHGTSRKINNFTQGLYDNKIITQQDIDGNIKDSVKFKNIGLTDEEIEQYLDGKDIILYKKDFNRLKLNGEN